MVFLSWHGRRRSASWPQSQRLGWTIRSDSVVLNPPANLRWNCLRCRVGIECPIDFPCYISRHNGNGFVFQKQHALALRKQESDLQRHIWIEFSIIDLIKNRDCVVTAV